jgi:hypothetical protein
VSDRYRPQSGDEKFAASRVVRSSYKLTDAQKLVWCEILFLDQGPTGAWISATGLADRLGRAWPRWIYQVRTELEQFGLLRKKYLEDDRTPSWFAELPNACRPTSGRAKQEEIRSLADRLDRVLPTQTPDTHVSSADTETPDGSIMGSQNTPDVDVTRPLTQTSRTPDANVTQPLTHTSPKTEETEETQSSRTPDAHVSSPTPDVGVRVSERETEGANAPSEETEVDPATGRLRLRTASQRRA